jgi:hypothetical protein
VVAGWLVVLMCCCSFFVFVCWGAESLNGVVEMARETLMINKRLSATTDQVLSRKKGKR